MNTLNSVSNKSRAKQTQQSIVISFLVLNDCVLLLLL
jgi:hypothetical protein